MNVLNIRFIIIGDSCVGKSCLINKYIKNEFKPTFHSTVGIDLKIKEIKIKGFKINFHIYDTAGQERFRSLIKNYYKGKDGAFLVFDLNNKESFDNLSLWLDEIKEKGNKNMKLIILGNKNDLKDIRQVTEKEIEEFKNRNGLKVIETSALSGEGINEAFEEMFNLITENMNNEDIYQKYCFNYNKKLLLKQNKNKSDLTCC